MTDDHTARAPSPPYTSFPSFKTLLATLKENSIPGRIDRSMLSKFSGGVAGQLLTALRFLGLTDDAGHPKPALRTLVDAFETDEWSQALSSVLMEAYAPLFELDLSSASPAQFNDAFRKSFSAEGDTFRKCVTFFLSAAKEADIAISAYIMQNKKPRLVLTKKRGSKVAAKVIPPVAANEGEPKTGDGISEKKVFLGEVQKAVSPEQLLLDLLDPEAMSNEETQAVLTLLLYLKKKT